MESFTTFFEALISLPVFLSSGGPYERFFHPKTLSQSLAAIWRKTIRCNTRSSSTHTQALRETNCSDAVELLWCQGLWSNRWWLNTVQLGSSTTQTPVQRRLDSLFRVEGILGPTSYIHTDVCIVHELTPLLSIYALRLCIAQLQWPRSYQFVTLELLENNIKSFRNV